MSEQVNRDTYSLLNETLFPRVSHRMVEHEGKIYIFGGVDRLALNIECYDIATNSLSTVGVLDSRSSSNGWYYIGVAKIENKVYLIGGYTSSRVRFVDTFDLVTYEYTKDVSYTPFHSSMETAVTVVGNEIYFVAGDYLETNMYRFNYETNTWTHLHQFDRRNLDRIKAIPLDERTMMLAFGKGSNREIRFYRTDTGEFFTKNNGPLSMSELGMSYAVYGNYVYFFGGYTSDFARRNVVHAYNYVKDTWDSDLTNFPISIADSYAVLYQDTIYVVGGTEDNIGRIYAYTPKYDGSKEDIPYTRQYTLKSFIRPISLTTQVMIKGGEIIPQEDLVQLNSLNNTSRIGHDCIEYNGKVYLFGGQSDRSFNVEEYDVETQTAKIVALMNSRGFSTSSGWKWLQVVRIDNYAYVLGGVIGNNTFIREVDRLNLDTFEWDYNITLLPLSPSNTSGYNTTAVAVGKFIYWTVCRTNGTQLYRLDTETLMWTQLPNINTINANGQKAVQIDERTIMYTLGTVPPSNTKNGTSWFYDIETNTVTVKENHIPEPIRGTDHAVVLAGKNVYVFGGDTNENVGLSRASKRIACYRVELEEWDLDLLTLERPNKQLSACTVGNHIYLSGGDGGTNGMYRYTPKYAVISGGGTTQKVFVLVTSFSRRKRSKLTKGLSVERNTFVQSIESLVNYTRSSLKEVFSHTRIIESGVEQFKRSEKKSQARISPISSLTEKALTTLRQVISHIKPITAKSLTSYMFIIIVVSALETITSSLTSFRKTTRNPTSDMRVITQVSKTEKRKYVVNESDIQPFFSVMTRKLKRAVVTQIAEITSSLSISKRLKKIVVGFVGKIKGLSKLKLPKQRYYAEITIEEREVVIKIEKFEGGN